MYIYIYIYHVPLWAMVPMGHGPQGPWSLWGMVPESPWAMAPTGHAPLGPWLPWAMAPMGHGPQGPWYIYIYNYVYI